MSQSTSSAMPTAVSIEAKPATRDITLLSGRTAKHRHMSNGAQEVYFESDPQEMTADEWEEYANVISNMSKRLQRLECCCCGQITAGRQWWNRDTGYGLCNDCIELNRRGSDDRDMVSQFGYLGVNYGINA